MFYEPFAPRGTTQLASCEPLVTFLATNKYITLLYVCLNAPYLIYFVASLIVDSQPTALYLIAE